MKRTSVVIALLFGLLLFTSPSQSDAASTWVRANGSTLGNGIFAYSSWSEADGSTDVTVHTTGSGYSWFIEDVVVERITDFSRGGDQASNLSAVTISLGDASSATRYMAATDIWTGAQATAPYTVGSATATTYRHVLAGGSAIKARVATTGANTNQVTAGKLAIYVKLAMFKPSAQ